MAHEFSAGGGGITPHTPQPPSATQQRLPHRATPKFWLRSHPMRWHLVDGEWLPQLGTVKADLGANGVDKGGNMDHAFMLSQAGGWTVIPWDAIEGGYLRGWPAQGGDYHCTAWEHPRWHGHRVLESKVDTDGYHAFLRQMIEDGYIPAPDPDILEQIHVDQQQKEVDRLAKESHKPGVQPVYEASKAKLQQMRDALAKLRGEAPAAPKRTAKGKR